MKITRLGRVFSIENGHSGYWKIGINLGVAFDEELDLVVDEATMLKLRERIGTDSEIEINIEARRKL